MVSGSFVTGLNAEKKNSIDNNHRKLVDQYNWIEIQGRKETSHVRD